MLAKIPMNGEKALQETENDSLQKELQEESADLERDQIMSLIELMEQEEQSSEWRQIRDNNSGGDDIPEFDLNVKLKKPGKGIPEKKAGKEEAAETEAGAFDIEKALAMADDAASDPINENTQGNTANIQAPVMEEKNEAPEIGMEDLYKALEGLDDDGGGFFFGGNSSPFQGGTETVTTAKAQPAEEPKKEEIKEPEFASETDAEVASELEKVGYADLAQLFDSDPMMDFNIALDNDVKFDFITNQKTEPEAAVSTAASASATSTYSDSSHAPPIEKEDEIPPEILFSVDESLIEIDDTGRPIEDLEAEFDEIFKFLDLSDQSAQEETGANPADQSETMELELKTEEEPDLAPGPIDSDLVGRDIDSGIGPGYMDFFQPEQPLPEEPVAMTAQRQPEEKEELQMFEAAMEDDDDEEVEAIDDYETTYRVKIEKYLQNGKRLTIREFLNDNILSDGIAKVLDGNLYLNKAASIKLYSRAEVFIVNDDVRNAVSLLESICLYSVDASYSTRALARLKTLVSPEEKDNVELLVKEMINKEMRLMNIIDRI